MPVRAGDRLRRFTIAHSTRLAFAGVMLVFLSRLLLAIAVIPPWQYPDEPQHFAFARLLARQPTIDLSQRRDVGIEREILQSMAEHRWWFHYGESTPVPLPPDFTFVPDHLYMGDKLPPVYYVVAAGWLKLTRSVQLLDQYYALRWLGVAFSIVTLGCIFAGTRLLFDDRVALGVAMLVALHPQFALASIAVNADVLVNLLAAVVWWQAARLLTGRTPAAAVLTIVTAVIVAVLTKRSSAPLVGIAGLVCAYGAGWLTPGRRRRALAATVTAGVLVVIATAALLPVEVARANNYWRELFTLWQPARALTWDYFRAFSTGLVDSAWLVAGWLRYPAPFLWRLIVRVLTVFAVLGLVLPGWREAVPHYRRGVLLALAFVVISLGAVIAGPYLAGWGPQGRYLLLVSGPWMTLVWVGLHAWWPPRSWPFVSLALIVAMLLLDVSAWTEVMIPRYVP